MIVSPWSPEEMSEFFEHYFYSPDAFFISEVISANSDVGEIQARCSPHTPWIIAPYQRLSEERHPRHVSGGDLVMLTASLGSLHAYFFHQCRWKEGWVGFGSRMEGVEFHNLAKLHLPLDLFSKELKVRRGAQRTLIQFEFKFSQDERLIYTSRQTALFVKQ